MLSDYEQAVENRRKAQAMESEILISDVVEPRTEKASLVLVENHLRELAEVVNRNAKQCDDNFAGAGRHVSELEGKLASIDNVLANYVSKLNALEDRLAKLEEPKA